MPSENIFSHTFTQTIWRILPHPSHDLWVVELRNPAERLVSWALLDPESGVVRWTEAPSATDWWTSLVAFGEEYVFLHNYRFPDVPEPTDLLAVSAMDGQLQWVMPGWVFVRRATDEFTVVAARKQPGGIQYHWVNAASGLPLEPVSEAEANLVMEPNFRTPQRYEPHDAYFDVLANFLQKTAGATAPIAIDYLEMDPYVVFSYYLYEQEKVAQYLLIVHRDRTIVYRAPLGQAREGTGRDTMLWHKGRLVCLRGTHEFFSIKLTQ